MSLNTTVFDISPSAATILAYGDSLCQGSFTPYSTHYSTRCRDTAQYAVHIDATEFAAKLSTIAGIRFTVEAWVYIEASTSRGYIFNITDYWGQLFGNYGNIWGVNVFAAEAGVYQLTFGCFAGISSVSVISTDALKIGDWNHIAVSIDSTVPADTTVWLSVNGAITVSEHQDFTQQIGLDYTTSMVSAGYTPSFWYINNLRVTKNQALYTQNFTPVLTPLSATADTVFLSFNKNRNEDFSGNNIKIHTIDTGDSAIIPFSPFTFTAGLGGSMYFNGAQTTYLAIPSTNTPSLEIGTQDFSIEMWVYMVSRSGDWQPLIGTFSSSGWYPTEANGWVLALGGNQHIIKFRTNIGGKTFDTVAAETDSLSYNGAALKEWTHIALTRESGVLKIYKNGKSVATSSFADDIPIRDLYIGRFGTQYFSGYLSDVRINVGSPTYTEDFTPPTVPLATTPNTVFLLPFQHSNLRDGYEKTNFYVKGGVTFDSAVKKFGTSSLKFDGSGVLVYTNSRLQNSPTSSNITTPFTIDFWFKTNTNNGGYVFRCQSISGVITAGRRLALSFNGASFTSPQAVDNDEWHHAAVVRDSGEYRFYIDGLMFASTPETSTGIIMKDPGESYYDPTVLGSYDINGTTYNYVGNVDNFRFTKYVRYTGETYIVPEFSDY